MRLLLRLAVLLLFAATLSQTASAQDVQYRGFWVDTFNTQLNNPAQVEDVISKAKAAKANALFVQIRRRGDAWYLNSLEPTPWDATFPPGFDALQTIITRAHAEGMEVHAYVIVAAIWNRHPTILPMPPANHVFSKHGFNTATGQIYTGRDNWLAKTLLPDSTPGAALTFQGQRINGEFWIDLGHPDAADYTLEVFMHLLKNYDIDGLHLDRIRYPEINVSGQTPSTGANIGYNETNVARFNAHYGRSGNPSPGDPVWMQWRRDQVTNFVRRVYLNAIDLKPQIKLSGSYIVFGGISNPTNENSWRSAEAYWRVYQDWRAWTEEGITDIAMPMNYKREHFTSNIPLFDQWNEWTKNHAYNRMTVIGQGAFLNSIEGTLKEVRKINAPSSLGKYTSGVSFFSMATSNAAVTASSSNVPGTPLTPLRSFAEFASGLTTGRSVNGAVAYEDQIANPVPVFANSATVPEMSWKTNPQVGYVKGILRDTSGRILDTGAVALQRISPDPAPTGRTSISTATDGSGFYGGVDLAPGTYSLSVTPTGQSAFNAACTFTVEKGKVTTFDVTIDNDAPTVSLALDRTSIWPPNGSYQNVVLSGTAQDPGTGIASITYRIRDEYGEVVTDPQTENIGGDKEASIAHTFTVIAGRRGDDKDGRTYTIDVTVTDKACNSTTQTFTLTVDHDRRR